MSRLRSAVILLAVAVFMTNAFACPDGQYSTCVVPNPFGGCIQSACVPKVGGVVGQTAEAAKRAVTVDPVRILVNPTSFINTSGIPTQGDVMEFVIKNPDKVIELINQPNQWPYMPVAASMISARNAVMNRSPQRIPESLKPFLRRWYPDDLLNSVRWSADWNLVQNTLQTAQMNINPNTQAITLINAVVFRDGANAQDVALWAHELYHVQQYRDWGVFGFAKRWVDNSSVGGPVEAPAYAREREARAIAGSYGASGTEPGPGAGSIASGSRSSGRGYPAPPPPGLVSGTVIRSCGCWGYTQFGMPFAWPQCRSGAAVNLPCGYGCYGGGQSYGTQCS